MLFTSPSPRCTSQRCSFGLDYNRTPGYPECQAVRRLIGRKPVVHRDMYRHPAISTIAQKLLCLAALKDNRRARCRIRRFVLAFFSPNWLLRHMRRSVSRFIIQNRKAWRYLLDAAFGSPHLPATNWGLCSLKWCPPGRCRYPQAQKRQTVTVARWRYHGATHLHGERHQLPSTAIQDHQFGFSSIFNPLIAKKTKMLS